jgi:hypothetical protein
VPPELELMKLSGMTTRRMGDYLVTHAPKSTDAQLAECLAAGGRALVEIAPQRNAMLHSRPVTDPDDPESRTGLLRWHIEKDPQEVHLISDEWLDRLVERIDDIQAELNTLRPPLERCASPMGPVAHRMRVELLRAAAVARTCALQLTRRDDRPCHRVTGDPTFEPHTSFSCWVSPA